MKRRAHDVDLRQQSSEESSLVEAGTLDSKTEEEQQQGSKRSKLSLDDAAPSAAAWDDSDGEVGERKPCIEKTYTLVLGCGGPSASNTTVQVTAAEVAWLDSDHLKSQLELHAVIGDLDQLVLPVAPNILKRWFSELIRTLEGVLADYRKSAWPWDCSPPQGDDGDASRRRTKWGTCPYLSILWTANRPSAASQEGRELTLFDMFRNVQRQTVERPHFVADQAAHVLSVDEQRDSMDLWTQVCMHRSGGLSQRPDTGAADFWKLWAIQCLEERIWSHVGAATRSQSRPLFAAESSKPLPPPKKSCCRCCAR